MRFLITSISEAFKEVNLEDLECEIRDYGLRAMKEAIELVMNNQVDQYLEELSHQVSGPKDRRNGYYSRWLQTELGSLELKVPRTRRISAVKLVGKLARRTKSVERLILSCFCLGMSTRKVGEALLTILGEKVSASLVSEIGKALDREVFKFHSRPLKNDYQILLLDAVVMRLRTEFGVRNFYVLVAMGISGEGKQEVIDFYLSPKSESENSWDKFLSLLYHRGLSGENLKLIVCDGHRGLLKAIDLVYPQVLVQRCWMHKIKNVLDKVKRSERKKVAAGLRKIHRAKNLGQARQSLGRFVRNWKPLYPKAVACLEEGWEDLFNFFQLEPKWWSQVKTTNLLERAFEEVRRRTKVMGVFKNRLSLERVLFSVFYHYNENQLPISSLTQNN